MRRLLLVTAGLLFLTFVAYSDVGRLGFVNLDDDAYVTDAPMVSHGLRPAGIMWALTSVHTANWHPFTTFSHMIDCDLFGIRAASMHWENLIWHLANTTLVFLLWRRLTGAFWRPAFVAALFALHPLHVESVAWISSRKDVLCTLFWLLGIGAYVRWTQKPVVWRYSLMSVCLAVALLFKPMAVTFPCTLLLLDGWPLRRWPAVGFKQLLWEKAPLFAVVLLHSIITFIVQHGAGAASYAERIPLPARLGNAVVGYVRYLGKTFWPETLSPLYWHPGYWPLWSVIGSVGLLALISVLAWRQRQLRPWFAFGWLWFLGTLVPVIGIVQVGAQSMADRYSYVPLLGVFTVFAWAGAELVAALPRFKTGLMVAVGAIVAGCIFASRHQVLAWENSITLYQRSIAAGEDNAAIRYLLALTLQTAGKPEAEVVEQYRRSLAHRPDYINALTRLAIIEFSHQRIDEARRLVEKTVQLEPKNPSLRANLGALAVQSGHLDEAIKHYEDLLKLDPKSAGAHLELGKIALGQNRMDEGRAHYEARARLTPWDVEALCDYGTLLGNLHRYDEAISYLERALWIMPGFQRARQNLASVRTLAQNPAAKR